MRAPVPDSDFAALVEACAGAERLVAAHPWLRVDTSQLTEPAGWKLHISSVPAQAEKLLKAVLPTLAGSGLPFKVMRSVGLLEELNDGRFGLTQVGKFITVYGGTEARIAAVLPELERLLEAFTGPAVVTDFRVRGNAPLYLRYGPFDGAYIVDALGQRIRQVRLPTGEEVADADVSGDPARVAPAKIACDPPSDHAGFLRERYLLVSALGLSAKGAAFIAVDQEATPRRLLLAKTARRGAHADRFGHDAVDALEREHALLARFGDLPGLPPAGDFIHNGGAAAVVRPYLDGLTLWHMWTEPGARTQSARRAHGHTLDAVAQSVAGLHDAGVIMRDLSPGNVLITDTGPVLLDLELAHVRDVDTPPYRRGTPGFYDPTRDRFALPELRDDRYALLALAWMFETGVFPALFAQGLAAVPDGIAAFSYARLWREAFGAMEESRDFLSAWRPVAAASGEALPPMPLMQSHLDDLSGHFAEELAAALSRADRSMIPFEEATAYNGLAGLLIIAEEVAPGAMAAHNPAALRGAIMSLEGAAAEVAHIPGVYFGASGIALAHFIVGARLKDAALVAQGREILEEQARISSQVPDITHGWAGFVHACLAAYRTEGDDALRELASDAGDRLITLMKRIDAGAVWPWPQGPYGSLSGATPHGFAHGTAGVVHALLTLYTETGEDVHRDAAMAGLETLHAAARTVDNAPEAVWWPVSEQDEACWNAWCHGTPGVVKALSQAVRVLHREEDRALLLRALRGIGAANNPGFCLCHGIASRLDAYAGALPVLGDDAAEFEQEAQRELAILAALETYTLEETAHSLERDGVSRGLMTGAAGVMRTVLRFQHSSTDLLLP